jgi:hypothetical protein
MAGRQDTLTAAVAGATAGAAVGLLAALMEYMKDVARESRENRTQRPRISEASLEFLIGQVAALQAAEHSRQLEEMARQLELLREDVHRLRIEIDKRDDD